MRKNLVFGLLTILVAGFGFGGISLAEDADNCSTIDQANVDSDNGDVNDNVLALIDTDEIIACFTTLKKAIVAANKGDTVKVLEDIDLNERIEINKSITLDLGGKTISNTNIQTFEITSDGDLTITGNGTIKGPTNGKDFDGKAIILVNGGKLRYINGQLEATGEGSDGMYGIYILDNGTAIFGDENESTGPSITSHFAAIGTNNTTAPANIIVYGGNYTAYATPGENDQWYYFCAPIYAASAGVYNIKGGTFNGYYGISTRYVHLNQNITIEEGVSFITTIENIFVDNISGTTPGTNRKIISKSNTKTLPEGYTWVEDGEDGYIVSKAYTVTFKKGEDNFGEVQIVAEGKKATEPDTNSISSEEGKVFAGWYKEAELTTEWDFDSDTVSENVTLYAKFVDPVAKIGDTNYATLQDAVDAAINGDTVLVLNNIDLSTQVVIEKSIILDLQGHKLYNNNNIWNTSNDSWSLISVKGANIDVTITGDGTLQAKENDIYAVDLRGGAKVTIENGTFVGNIHAVYVLEGELTVNGGNYKIQQLYCTLGNQNCKKPYEFVLNCLDGNYINGTCKISVKGGTFNKFNPASNGAEGAIGSTNFLAEGYESKPEGDTYVVSAIDYTITISDSISNGKVSADKTNANIGDEITLTPTPNSNYNFSKWNVKDADDNEITVTDNKFTMPAKDVTVSATFTKIPTGSGRPASSSSSSSSSSNTTKDDTKAAPTEDINLGGEVTEESTTTTSNDENTATPTSTNKPTVTAADTEKYGEEQIDAYKWAHEEGITTMNSVEDARLDSPLTRAELAKMMVVYIKNVKKISPVIDEVGVIYSDVDKSLGDLYDYIQLARAYKIMGINADGTPIKNFNPNGLVSRADYATVFSRVLFGDTYNKEGADYYTNHITALEKAGILTNTNPTIQEVRGWVMLMMYRSANTKAEEDTPAEENKVEETTTEETAAEEGKLEETIAGTGAVAETTTGDVAKVSTGATTNK